MKLIRLNLYFAGILCLIFLNIYTESAGAEPDSIIQIHNHDFSYRIKKIQQAILVDGKLDEPDWQQANIADSFFRVLPVDSGLADSKSEVRMLYDDKAFYLAVTFFDELPGKRIMESFRRDFVFGNNDNFLAFFDTFLDQTNGFSFGVSASGAKWDGIMSDGARINLIWDCKWESKTVHFNDRWVSEMRIPFRSVRYKTGGRYWLANFSRNDLKRNEKSSWAPVPRQFPTASLAYTGILEWEEPLPPSPVRFSVIPYVFGSAYKNNESGANIEYGKDAGFDAKIGLSNAMNLDLTYNPDFSQSEVDAQVTNLDRYELFFPEKRQFFLENSDLFAGYGYPSVTPFFSRRIGLDAPVLAGARLSGKPAKDWRLGLMTMQTEKTSELLSRNYTVASVQRQIFARSNVGFIFVNKENFNKPDGQKDFNRVFGLDYNLASKDNLWTGKFFYHRSFDEINPGKQYAQGAQLEYKSRKLELEFAQTSVGENYNAETGFVRRKGYNFLGPELEYLWVPNRWITNHGITLKNENYFNADYQIMDQQNTLMYSFVFRDRSEFKLGIDDYFVHLEHDFDPTNQSGLSLKKGTEYHYQGYWGEYLSDNRKDLSFRVTLAKGSYFNGKFNVAEGNVNYRIQPYVNLNLAFSYNDIDLPAPFVRTRMWLVSPKVDVTFSEKLFLSTFVQYNEQIENMNLNLRFQWRYKPVSDIFVVYTGNYFTSDFSPRNRAIVVKMSYWFN